MKKLGLALCLIMGLAPAHAQPVTGPVPAGIAGAYNTGTVTCTNLQFCFLQTDVNGNVKVVLSGTPSGTQDINIKQYGGVAVGATNAQYVQPGTGATWLQSNFPTTVDTNAGAPGASTIRIISGGYSNIATSQVSVANSSTVTVAARVGRYAVTITATGSSTQDVYCGPGTIATNTGDIIPGVKGAARTYLTAAAINCITAASTQTVTVSETY